VIKFDGTQAKLLEQKMKKQKVQKKYLNKKERGGGRGKWC
jgi:hypothetical protein